MPRIRLQSCAPLPTLKAWFLIPNNVENVWDLKLALCSQLSMLKQMHLFPTQLALELDGFEILNESPVDLVREADVITLKKEDNLTEEIRATKRKFDVEDAMSSKTKRRKISNKNISSPAASSSSTSDTQRSDVSSSSASSSSGSDSDSSSSDSESSDVSTRMTKVSVKATTPLDVNSSTKVQQITVPPGFGKPSTKARNRRRRIRRKFLVTPSKAVPVSSASVLHPDPLDSRTDINIAYPNGDPVLKSVPVPFTVATPKPILSSVGNKNKRKGFKKSMENIQPHRLVFDPSTFVPPSERESLPDNILVTSVDVEWRIGKGHWQETSLGGRDLVPEMKDTKTMSEKLESQTGLDWTAVETRWGKYPRIEDGVSVPLGGIVAWRGFGLDPVTLTPQLSLLHLGKVIAMDADTLTVTLLAPPGVGPAAFGRVQINEEEDCASEERISTSLTEIWSSDWRLVSNE